jgi:putative sugar O-methyltransferase
MNFASLFGRQTKALAVHARVPNDDRHARREQSAAVSFPHWRADPLVEQSLDFHSFKDRRAEGESRLSLADAERIIRAYCLAKAEEQGAAEAFKPSGEWVPIFAKSMERLRESLERRDARALMTLMSNFFREECSLGLAGYPFSMQTLFTDTRNRELAETDWRVQYFLCDAVYRYRLLQSLTGDQNISERLVSPEYGNSYGILLDGNYVKLLSDYQLYYADRLRTLCNSDPAGDANDATVGELGGGWGGLAYFFIRDNTRAKYFNFDLPEVLVLAQSYLMAVHPGRRYKLYGEDHESFDVALLPSFELRNAAGGSFDAFFNSYSLAEMNVAAAREYIDLIGAATKQGGAFLNINHRYGSAVTIEDFPLEPQFRVVSRIPALWNAFRFGTRFLQYETVAIRID